MQKAESLPSTTGKYYTGIGSRDTPDDIKLAMRGLGGYLARAGYTLRSGAADGADKAFEEGCDKHQGCKEIFLPWFNFNDHKSPYWRIGLTAFDTAEEHHTHWHNLNQANRKLAARNVYQVEGKDHDEPADFLVCWTSDGKEVGGSALAIRLAKFHGIPVFNFGSMSLDEIQDGILEYIASTT